MKVYILAKGSTPWENGRLIYKEALVQKKNVELGFLEWQFKHILRSITKSAPDWIFVTGSRSLFPAQLKELAKIAKVAIWDADGVYAERDKIWQSICGIPSAVFSVISDIDERYPTLSSNAVWTPQYYDDVTYAPSIDRPTKDKDFVYDVCFFGSLDKKRADWLKRLTEDGITVGRFLNIRGKAMANAYARSRIAIAIWRDVGYDVGYFTVSDRIYKAMGCGAFYLLHPVGNLESMFKNKVHLDSYDDTYESLKEKIDYYLKNPVEREQIAKVGQKEILEKHTLKVRLNQYWKVMEDL